MIGSLDYSSQHDYDPWEDLEKLEDYTGINFTEAFDSIQIEKLPNNGRSAYDDNAIVPARTEQSWYGLGNKTTLKLDPEHIYDFTEEERLNLLAHEGIHGLDFNNKLEGELVENEYVDKSTFRELENLMDQGLEEMEGVTQKLANEITSDSAGRKFRPRETAHVERYLEQEDIEIDFDEELEYLNQSEEVYDQIITDDMYFESGSIGETDYIFIYTGEDAEEIGENIKQDYMNYLDQIEDDPLFDLEYLSNPLTDYKEERDGWKEVDDGGVSMNDTSPDSSDPGKAGV